MTPTNYIVLRRESDTQLRVVGEVEAGNDVAAIQDAAGHSQGDYVAVARRNFRVRTVTVENKPVVKIA